MIELLEMQLNKLTDKFAIKMMKKRIELLKELEKKRDSLQRRINNLSDTEFLELRRLSSKLEIDCD